MLKYFIPTFTQGFCINSDRFGYKSTCSIHKKCINNDFKIQIIYIISLNLYNSQTIGLISFQLTVLKLRFF